MLENVHKDITIRMLEFVDCNVKVKENNRKNKLVRNNSNIPVFTVFPLGISQFNLIKKKKKKQKFTRKGIDQIIISNKSIIA